MSIAGAIGRATVANPLDAGATVGDILGIVRGTDSPAESLGIRPDYGEDGVGIGIILPPISNEPVDPGKLGGLDISPPLPVVIIGKDEICVGVSIGIGYEVKGMICHRDKPADEPKPPGIPPNVPPEPIETPENPVLPDIDLNSVVMVLVGAMGVTHTIVPANLSPTGKYLNFLQSYGVLKVNSVRKNPETGVITWTEEQFAYTDNGYNDGMIAHSAVLSQGAGVAVVSDFLGQKTVQVKREGQSTQPYRQPQRIGGFQGGGATFEFGRWGDILQKYNNFQSSSFAGQFTTRVTGYSPVVLDLSDFDNTYKPTPYDEYPVEQCKESDCMKCCDKSNKDDSELLKLVARTLGCTQQGHFMELPKSLLKTESNLFGKLDESLTVKLKSQSEFNAYLVEQLVNIIGIPEIALDVPANIQKASGTEANRLAGKIVIPDLFSGIAMLLKLSLNVQDDESELRSFLTRILTETHLSRLAAYDAACRAQALQDWTGMQIEEIVEQMPVTFTPPAPTADLDKIDSNSEIKAFLQESKRSVKRIKYNGKFGFKNVAEQLLQGVAIIRSVFAVRIKPGADAKKQIKDVLKGQHEIATGKIGDKGATATSSGAGDGLKDFARQIEKQFKGIKIDIDNTGGK